MKYKYQDVLAAALALGKRDRQRLFDLVTASLEEAAPAPKKPKKAPAKPKATRKAPAAKK